MNSELTAIELRIQLNYDLLTIQIMDSNTNEMIGRTGATPAGVEWYVALYIHFREEHRMMFSRSSIERMLTQIGAVLPDKYPQQTIVMRGRNLDTGLPDSIEMSTLTIYEIISPLLMELSQSIKWHLMDSLFLDSPPLEKQRLFNESLDSILQTRSLVLQTVIFKDGDFPPVKGFDHWLQTIFNIPVQYVRASRD